MNFFRKSVTAPIFLLQATKGTELKDINFFSRFVNKTAAVIFEISPMQFLDITRYYCASGYDFVANEKIEQFMQDYEQLRDYEECNPPVIEETDVKPKVAKARFEEKKKAFIESYDMNRDGKIDIRDLSRMLPLQQPFNQLFYIRKALKSSFDFLKLFIEYDKNCDGNIDFQELKAYVTDTLRLNTLLNLEESTICHYTSVLLKIYDFNNDGMLHLSEFWRQNS
ncbi:calbindin-32-like protein [Leptotrombidium deliense]|uniref:Calbindin-32-like protein n=1 Tax=Leptotrombidium deliense TaxID=299467 RepID=A0A443SFY6_9ACAR|nr:calbindin-32-like protein [Leptotrombidium deliense]